jgi:hypothetical protein
MNRSSAEVLLYFLATSLSPMAVSLALFMGFFGSARLTGTEPAQMTARKIGAIIDSQEVLLPDCHAVINVKKAPYNAKGDGIADDTEAIQKALTDMMGLHRILYFPKGTYLISKTLMWSKKNSQGRDAWGMNTIQGHSAHDTTIRLKDGTFEDPMQPSAIMWCGGFGSADWFHNYVQDITFDVGQRNAGAIGLQFYSNNSGAVRNCRFIAATGSGLIGLDLGHRDMNGPLLVRNCEVTGFARGISTANGVNGQCFEHITLSNQRECGFSNAGQSISIRGLSSYNEVPAISTYGVLYLMEAKLTGDGNASNVPAIVNYNYGRVGLRDITTTGYRRALGDVETPDSARAYQIDGPDKPGSQGPNITEYFSHSPASLFPSTSGSLRLTIKEPPPIIADSPSSWANVDDFGADPTGNEDSSAAIQKAMDSGASTIFFPGNYALKKTVVVGGKVHRILGVGGMVDYTRQAQPDFRVVDGESPVVVFEHFAHIHGGIEVDTQRTLYLKSIQDCDLTCTENSQGGEFFFEDVVTHKLALKNQRAWARQLNVENEGLHVLNDSSDLWVLGYKTERGGTLLQTQGKGRSEILGGFSYTTTAGKLAPMFINRDASVFAFFNEVCYNDDPFETLVEETRNGKKKQLKRGDIRTMPYIGVIPSP